MSDTCCQRHGYDDTGRYHVPGPTVIHEPGWTGPAPSDHEDATPAVTDSCTNRPDDERFSSTEAVNIPLDLQLWMFEHGYTDALITAMDMLDVDGEYDDELLELARARLREGHTLYGSEMYTWTPEERLRNVLEELADAAVYLTSGPIP